MLVDELSQLMRANHSNIGLGAPGAEIPKFEDPTMVEWITSED